MTWKKTTVTTLAQTAIGVAPGLALLSGIYPPFYAALLPYYLTTLAATGTLALWSSIETHSKKKSQAIRTKLRKVFERTGCCVLTSKDDHSLLFPRLKKIEEILTGTKLTLTLPEGMKPLDIENLLPEISYAFNAVAIMKQYQRDLVIYLNTRDIPNKLDYPEFNWPELLKNHSIPVPLGEGVFGPITLDLAKLPHCMIGGESGGGKTTALHVIIHALEQNPCVDIEVIDFAGTDLGYVTGNYCYTKQAAIEMMARLTIDLNNRLTLLREAGQDNIIKYNSTNKDKLKFKVILVDELGVFRDNPSEDKEERKATQNAFHRLIDISAMGRKAGMHLVLSTQRPDKQVMPALIKANSACTLAFRTKNQKNSQILLDHGAAAKLPRKPGRAILQWSDEQEMQVYYLPGRLTNVNS